MDQYTGVIEERSEQESRELRVARFMCLDYQAVSDQGRQACKQLSKLITLADPERQYERRGKKLLKFEQAVASTITDLVLGLCREKSDWSYRTLSPSTFTQCEVSHRHFIAVIRGMRALGYIKSLTGFYNRPKQPGDIPQGFNWATRFRPTSVLLNRLSYFGVTPQNLKEHFTRKIPLKPLVLRLPKQRIGTTEIPGKEIRFKTTEVTKALENDIGELNKFLSGIELIGGKHAGFRRIFNQGRQENYQWNKGGRLCDNGEPSYQSLPKQDRGKMILDGEPVIELDIRASHLSIFYAQNNLELDPTKDPYSINTVPRDIVKFWINRSFGGGKFHRSWNPEFRSKFAPKYGSDVNKDFPIKEVRRLVLAEHPALETITSRKITCFDLMYLESEAILGTMLELKRLHSAPSLCVYDSIIVKRSDRRIAEAALKNNFQKTCGFVPIISA